MAGTFCAADASAQVSLNGEWSPRYHEDFPDRIPGPELGDYTGLPITEGARRSADSWDASRLSLPEHQCKVHISPYIYHGPLQYRFTEDRDLRTQRVIAIKQYVNTFEMERTIWMDGREHPPAWAPATWAGFSTGRWEGDVLVVTTTSLNDQTWLDRAGNHHSNKLKVTERFTLLGPNHIWYEATLDDPLTYSRPWTLEMPLYRLVEKNAHLLEHKCVPFADMLLYQDLLLPKK